MQDVTLLVGLGNPGQQLTRHNIGFDLLDHIAKEYKLGSWSNKFSGAYLRGTIASRQVMCLKPMTYMNLSGKSVAECARFFRLNPANILIIHDDLDLALGKIKVKLGGGNGGHNGLASIDEMLGTSAYHRLRVGIGHPGERSKVSSYVLSRFAAGEEEVIEQLLSAISHNFPLLLSGHPDRFIELTKLPLLLQQM